MYLFVAQFSQFIKNVKSCIKAFTLQYVEEKEHGMDLRVKDPSTSE